MSEEPRTIAAIATSPGRGGVAIVRVSGPDAFAVVQALTNRAPEIGRIAFRRVRSPAQPRQLLDACLVLAFAAPHSYTGEDVVEFQCHGGAVTPRRILEACFAAGARLARRGEFTERAFLNGKLDYAEAESVLALVDARTSRAADEALAGLDGARRRRIRALYDAAVTLGSELEHALDIDEGELAPAFFRSVQGCLDELIQSIRTAVTEARSRRILRTGALVVLSGPPNVGKSSLMNALLGTSRAIVSDTPGTTRDSIEEWLDIDGWPVRLVDTAGLRTTDDPIEGEGVRRALALADRADLVLELHDASDADDVRSIHPTDDPHRLVLLTKADLTGDGAEKAGAVRTSVRASGGLDALRLALAGRLEKLAASADEGTGETPEDLARYLEALPILEHIGTLDETSDLVIAANLVRQAAERLGTLLGATYASDMLDRLFSRFCVGK